MPSETGLPAELGRLVGELRALGDKPLLRLWQRTDGELARAGRDRAGLQRRYALRRRSYACRLPALERFGWAGHLKRYRDTVAAADDDGRQPPRPAGPASAAIPARGA